MTTQGSGIRTADQTNSEIDRILQLVAPKLALVEDELRKKFESEVATVRDVGDHILQGGGKRLRPVLLLLVSEMLGYKGLRDVTWAAVVELIHTATLVHDDIIDEAEVRRGKTSVNYRWGNQVTVLIGDLLYAHAMDVGLADGGVDVLRLLSGVTIYMTEGEILGLEYNGRSDLTSEEYFDIVERKTAALFGASCRIPAQLTGLEEERAAALYDFGRNIGICFQLVDDLLDFTSSTEVLGKPALSDLKEGKITLPLILALPSASEDERAMIRSVVSNRSFGAVDPQEIVAIAQRHDAIERTYAVARDYSDRARAILRSFPDSPARNALEWAVDFVVARHR